MTLDRPVLSDRRRARGSIGGYDACSKASTLPSMLRPVRLVLSDRRIDDTASSIGTVLFTSASSYLPADAVAGAAAVCPARSGRGCAGLSFNTAVSFNNNRRTTVKARCPIVQMLG